MRNLILLYIIVILTSQSLFAQYQKTINTNTLNISGFENYYSLAYSRQISKKDNIALSLSYYADIEDTFSNQNYVGNFCYKHSILRIHDLYLNGGGGFLFVHTKAEDIIGNNVTDYSTGLSANLDLEYYLSHWLILFGDFKQMVFLNSDFYNSQFLYSFGLKIVF